MQLDFHSKLALQVGKLMLQSLETAHTLEGVQAEAAAHKARADALQAEKDAAKKVPPDAEPVAHQPV